MPRHSGRQPTEASWCSLGVVIATTSSGTRGAYVRRVVAGQSNGGSGGIVQVVRGGDVI